MKMKWPYFELHKLNKRHLSRINSTLPRLKYINPLGARKIPSLSIIILSSTLFLVTGFHVHAQSGSPSALEIIYRNTNLTACPIGETLKYFYHWELSPPFVADSWCGAALADLDWATIFEKDRSRIPYKLESCDPGNFWTYSHQFPYDPPNDRYYSPPHSDIHMICLRPNTCPPDSRARIEGDTTVCDPVVDKYPSRTPIAISCGESIKNPIYPMTGVKRETLQTGIVIGGKSLNLTYDSSRMLHSLVAIDSQRYMNDLPSLGKLWLSSFHKKLNFSSFKDPDALLPKWVNAMRGNGAIIGYEYSNGGFVNSAGNRDALQITIDGFLYTDSSSQTLETYSASGRLLSSTDIVGSKTVFTYSDSKTPVGLAPAPGYLLNVTDSNGRVVRFQYVLPAGGNVELDALVSKITDSSGNDIAFSYAPNGNLSSVTWQDKKTRSFLYEKADIPWALTGVFDELGNRFSTFGYDSAGRAISSEHANGVEKGVLSYGIPPVFTVTEVKDPATNVVTRTHYITAPENVSMLNEMGVTIEFKSEMVLGSARISGKSQPAGSGCAASSQAMTYDTNGNKISHDDFNGKRVCYAYDAQNQEVSRVEGLAGGDTGTACSGVTAADATLPTGSRRISTQWHPDWRLESRIAQPGKITTLVYNGQPDPTAGNAIVSCAPATAKLPDGKPIAVLCKRVEQATTDASGAAGFAAAAQVGVAARTWKYKYNKYGQILTEDGPRTDVSDVTTYTYHAATAFTGTGASAVGVTLGDLKTVTNAAGKATQFTKYNKHGQLLESIDPNGVVTTNTYDLRQRLLSTSIDGQKTTYTYDPVGLLKRITRPDDSWVGYDYDAAHRQTAAYDNLGNRIDYTLDNAGNVTAQAVKDPSGVLRKQLTSSIDALGRVQQTTGRE